MIEIERNEDRYEKREKWVHEQNRLVSENNEVEDYIQKRNRRYWL